LEEVIEESKKTYEDKESLDIINKRGRLTTSLVFIMLIFCQFFHFRLIGKKIDGSEFNVKLGLCLSFFVITLRFIYLIL